MWIYLLISVVIMVIYFMVLLYAYIMKKDYFWQKDITMLLLVGIAIFVIELVTYFTNNYGFFMLGLALETFYLVIEIITVRQRLFQ